MGAEPRRPRTPERYHAEEHGGRYPIGECHRCIQEAAKCRKKIRFVDRAEADAWVTEYNETHGYIRPMCRYRCRWCGGDAWHMCTVDPGRGRDRHAVRRVEKQRRKWLFQQQRRGLRVRPATPSWPPAPPAGRAGPGGP